MCLSTSAAPQQKRCFSSVKCGLVLRHKLRNSNPSAELLQALRKPGADETRIQGTLLRLECDVKGIAFVIQTAGGLLRLKTPNFEQISIMTFNSEVKGEITCGLRKGENVVVVCYVPSKDARAKTDGLLRSVEFVPKDFTLKT